MNRRQFLVGASGLAVTTTIAGCTSSGSSGESGTTTNNTTNDTEASVSLADVEYPAGWSEEGIQDPEAVTQAHEDALEGTSYSRTQVMDSNQMYNFRGTSNSKFDPENKQALINSESTYRSEDRSGTAQRDIYIAGGTRYEREKSAGSQTYKYSTSNAEYNSYHNNEDVYQTVGMLALTAQETVQTEGTTGIKFEVTGIRPEIESDVRFTNDSYGGVQEGTVTVTTEGRIASYDVNLGAKDETEQWLERSVEWTPEENLSISEPDWISNIDEASS